MKCIRFIYCVIWLKGSGHYFMFAFSHFLSIFIHSISDFSPFSFSSDAKCPSSVRNIFEVSCQSMKFYCSFSKSYLQMLDLDRIGKSNLLIKGYVCSFYLNHTFVKFMIFVVFKLFRFVVLWFWFGNIVSRLDWVEWGWETTR